MKYKYKIEITIQNKCTLFPDNKTAFAKEMELHFKLTNQTFDYQTKFRNDKATFGKVVTKQIFLKNDTEFQTGCCFSTVLLQLIL